MSPVRIQRKRTKGWRMPDGAVYVGRPTVWGNPWPVDGEMQPWLALALGQHGGLAGRRASAVIGYRWWVEGMRVPFPVVGGESRGSSGDLEYTDGTIRHLSDLPAAMGLMMLARNPIGVPPVPDLEPLRGRDLACWCPIGQPCHADVLIELANR